MQSVETLVGRRGRRRTVASPRGSLRPLPLREKGVTDMGFWGRLGCRVGLHGWSPWEYEAALLCRQVRRCQRPGCTKTDAQALHDWGEWQFVTPTSCEQCRRCPRCGSRETRQAAHDWGEWQYVAPASCE